MNQEEQIMKLNSITKVTLGFSKKRIGVFALTFISMGEKLYLDNMPEVFKIPFSSFNKLFPEVKKQILERCPQVKDDKAFVYPDTRYLAYVNRSDKGRAEPDRPNYDESTDTSLRDIKKGDEILMAIE